MPIGEVKTPARVIIALRPSLIKFHLAHEVNRAVGGVGEAVMQ